MIDLIIALQKVLDKSAKSDAIDQISRHGKGGAWHVISDYVFGNPDRHDTASFVILLNHDNLKTILKYIDNQAPVDIKKSKHASEGLIRYLNSPVVFSYTFVLDDGDNFLSGYSPASQITEGLEEIKKISESMRINSEGIHNNYFTDAEGRISRFINELKQKGNAKLARQVFLVAAYAAIVFDYLDSAGHPSTISWISDRDALVDRHDGIVWDIAWIYFCLLKGNRNLDPLQKKQMINMPKFILALPDGGKENYLDPLIRMADYLAAAASDINLNTFDYSHPKLQRIGTACFAEARNHVLCTISWTGDGFYVRRISGRPTSKNDGDERGRLGHQSQHPSRSGRVDDPAYASLGAARFLHRQFACPCQNATLRA